MLHRLVAATRRCFGLGHSQRPAVRPALRRLAVETLEDRTVPASINWTGAVSSDWATAGNWDANAVPGASDLAVINLVKTNAPIVSADTTVGGVELDGGSLTLNATLTDNGDLTFAGPNAAQLSGGTINVLGNVVLSSSTNMSFSSTIGVQGDWTNSGSGAVDATGSTVNFNNSSMGVEQHVDDSTTQFNNVILSQGFFDGLTVNGTMDVTNLTLDGGSYSSFDSGTIAVSGNVTANNPYFHGTGTIELTGTGTVSASNGGQLTNVAIDSTANVTLSGTIGVLGDWTNTNGGTVTATGSTVSFDNQSMGVEQSVNDTTTQFNNVTLSQGFFDGVAVSGTMHVTNLTLDGSSYSSLDSGTIAVAGNITANNPYFHGTGTIELTGTGTVSASNGGQLPNVVIDSTANVTLSGNIGVLGDWTNNGGTVTATGSTVSFDNQGFGVEQNVNDSTTQFDNVSLSQGFFDGLKVTGTMNVTNLTLDGSGYSSIDSGIIAASGNVTANNPEFHGAGTIELNGTGTLSTTNGGQLPSVLIDTTGTVTLSGTIGVLGDWTYTAGTVTATGSDVIFDNTGIFVTQHITTVNGSNSMKFDTLELAVNWFDTIAVNGTVTANNLTIDGGGTIFILDGGTIDFTTHFTNNDMVNGVSYLDLVDGATISLLI
jgi:hypothetical protein